MPTSPLKTLSHVTQLFLASFPEHDPKELVRIDVFRVSGRWFASAFAVPMATRQPLRRLEASTAPHSRTPSPEEYKGEDSPEQAVHALWTVLCRMIETTRAEAKAMGEEADALDAERHRIEELEF